MAALRIIEAKTIDEDKGLLEGGATDGEVRLHAVAGSRLDIDGRVEPEVIGHFVEQQWLSAGIEDIDRAVVGGERHWLKRGGDIDAFGECRGRLLNLRRLLHNLRGGIAGWKIEKAKEEECQVCFHCSFQVRFMIVRANSGRC